MNEGRFVLAERKSPGRLFYVIKDDSQEELEKFVSWVEIEELKNGSNLGGR